ncbi:transcriptional regulator [Altererythrobacter aerius]|uniref:Transcriptional regulator n=1 Tax=Tsuneonella aeria TaxID=1837929 RepID=A0A6I4T8U4_9SPHN|nr:transcriptional regulator [Tsuneonella aeria]MXO73741.1 transcriptional regulator [Tsuneonella aeria]
MPHTAYAFGPFHLDPADRRLLRDGAPVEVSARYLDALILLASENGRLVSKDRFHAEVWRGIPVTDEALTQCIRSLRKALDDDAANPAYIETVPRHGYRFIAPVTEAQSGAIPAANGPVPVVQLPAAWPGAAREVLAAAFGGAIAGIVGAIGYVMAGLVAPGVGAASTMLTLVTVNLVLGFAAGAFVGGGIAAGAAWGGRSVAWLAAGGAAGGLLVGAIARMIGTDLLTLFFGQAPVAMTGAAEGAIIGAASGIAAWIAARGESGTVFARIAPAPVLGAAAGAIIALAGGRLMIGSLAALADRFAQSRLRIDGVATQWLALVTAAECALFVTGVVAALVVARRLGPAR